MTTKQVRFNLDLGLVDNSVEFARIPEPAK